MLSIDKFFFFSWLIQLEFKTASPDEKKSITCWGFLAWETMQQFLMLLKLDWYMLSINSSCSIFAWRYHAKAAYENTGSKPQPGKYQPFFPVCWDLAPSLMQCRLESHHFGCGRLWSSQQLSKLAAKKKKNISILALRHFWVDGLLLYCTVKTELLTLKKSLFLTAT